MDIKNMRPIAHPPLRYASLAHAQPTLPFVPNGSIRYAYGLLKDRDIIPFREKIVYFNSTCEAPKANTRTARTSVLACGFLLI